MPGARSSKQSSSNQEQQPLPPFRYSGGDLGLNSHNEIEPWIYFVDSAGQRWLTHSVEYVLCRIDDFAKGRDQDQLLAAAAVHYGFEDVWILIKGRGA